MWGAISRLFNKQNGKSKLMHNDSNGSVMDKAESRKFKEREVETHESRLAKQKAILKWMLVKAFNGRVPENLREPFYKDHEESEHLKPKLVHYLASAELYCMALSNIYSDPNYNSLNHTGIIQALARKGISLSDPNVTETTLIQTTPIKLGVHQIVMQGIMTLYAREVATPELVVEAVDRFLHGGVPAASIPHDHERALLLWINKAIEALKLRAQHQQDNNKAAKWSELSPTMELQDLCDGVCLASLVSFYCPEALHLDDIIVTQLPTVSDCVENLTLVRDFCRDYLPVDIFLMQPEEVYCMRGSMRQNLIVFLADLFNMFEINPAKCVTLKGLHHSNVEGRNSQGVSHKRSLPQCVTAIPDLRPSLDTPSTFSGSPVMTPGGLKKLTTQYSEQSDNRNGGGEEFVVHRGRGVPTLSSVLQQQHQGMEVEPAGKPTNWGDHRKPSFAGRRSRRNSLSEDSQLTLENLCGSQENLHLLGRNPDKEPAVHSGKRETPSSIRSSILDNNSSALHTALNHVQPNSNIASGGNGIPEIPPRKSLSRNNSFIESQRRAEETRSSAGIQQTLLEPSPPPSPKISQHSTPDPPREKKVTSFAALPNNTTTTTWQSLSNQASEQTTDNNGVIETADGSMMGSQLINIRMKLEEKRRRIENEKKRMEAQLNRQRQKLGKEAFLQAISKGKAAKSPESDPGKESVPEDIPHPARPFSLQDISEVEQKWLKGDIFIEERKTPDLENMDIESYQRSIAQMDSSLHEIQADLHRLTFEQSEIGRGDHPPHHHHPPPLPLRPPPMQSFASLHSQPTYNNINYVNNIPHQGEYNSTVQQNMYNSQQRVPPVDQGFQYSRNNQNYPNPQTNSPYPEQRLTNIYQEQQQRTVNYPESGRIQQGYQERVMNNYQDANPRSKPAYPPPEPPRPNQWQQSPHSNYENFSPRYSDGGYGHVSNYSSESGYGGSKGMEEVSHGTSAKGEFYLHEPSPSHRRPSWQTPDSWHPQRREPVSLSSSPQQHSQQHRLIENGDGGYRTSPPSLAPTPPPRSHAPVQPPPPDDMEPQSISFIGTGDEEVPGLSKIQITSGNRTYRVSSPTKGYVPIASRPSQDTREQGFYISFDDDQSSSNIPRRPKPPLRTKRNSPKKERDLTQTLDSSTVPKLVNTEGDEIPVGRSLRDLNIEQKSHTTRVESRLPPVVHHFNQAPQESQPQGLLIGAQPDSVTLDEMERKKERIVMLSLQRRQAAEDARNRKEAEAARRRDEDKLRQEERTRKKEEDRKRRATILEQHKIKKAIEEAEREGKQVDKELLNCLKVGLGNINSGPKMRNKTHPTKPRPKTVHMDSDITDASPNLSSSRAPNKGSSSNLSVIGRPMRRDYYRGSQDCLTETRRPNSLYQDPSPDVRSLRRPRYGTYQAYRKSTSLMNLAGGSSVGEGECDSGLGRATRAPSPSGPGSLPLRPRRQQTSHYADDAASEAGSDYSGPRLYRQPTTKSNKGIIVNAIEYCVFPGAVNKEAKRKVLEEINRCEAKHFLVLFRDAGCQFRALYTYYPDSEEVIKLYGTGPKQVHDRMFDKFFKYNSGGKCFSQVHTKHLTVTIDAFTIHNSLWQGKKVNLPNKSDMTLVI